jgi:hypothetical protein
MITKDSFIKIVDALDEYFNGDVAKALYALNISENVITDLMDNILSAIGREIDPEEKARTDEKVSDCGDYICSYLFSETEFQELCPTAGALYDYIRSVYETHKEAE